MAHVICIVSQKGGTGKTTTAANLAGSLALFERKTLLIDCDPLGNATTGLGIEKSALNSDLSDAFASRIQMQQMIVDTDLEFLQVVPARYALFDIEKSLPADPDPKLFLRRMVEPIMDRYDYILLDAPPSLNFLAISAIICSDWLLIPIQSQIFTLEGMGQLLKIARQIQQTYRPDLRIAGVLFTMCPSVGKGVVSLAEELLDRFKENVFRTTIPWDGLLRESSDFGRPLVLHDITARGARAYLKLSMELVRFFEDAKTQTLSPPSFGGLPGEAC